MILKIDMGIPDTLVKVIVPVYRDTLEPYERISLKQNRMMLSRYPFVFVRPEGLDISSLMNEFPGCREEVFDRMYFGNLLGYNRLMMSAEFYRRFSDTEYLLICQLDAYVFRDELAEWCGKGYDYVGAPWPVPGIYRFPLLKQWRKFAHSKWRTEKDFKVGNGGFSLRKVSSHIRATEQLQDAINKHLERGGYRCNEDLFFSLEVNKHGMGFTYPSFKEALHFSFDRYPLQCYIENRFRLPFGCHGWYKKKARKFWFRIIRPSRFSAL